MIVSQALWARFTNGLQMICKARDTIYTEVIRYISGDNNLACTAAHDIYNKIKNPSYWLFIEACQQSLLRAQETLRHLVQAFFEKNFQLLRVYKQQHDNCLVPGHQGFLGKWVDNLRTRKKTGKLRRGPSGTI